MVDLMTHQFLLALTDEDDSVLEWSIRSISRPELEGRRDIFFLAMPACQVGGVAVIRDPTSTCPAPNLSPVPLERFRAGDHLTLIFRGGE